MQTKLTTIREDDREKAPCFHTDSLVFVKKADVRQGPYRWLTVLAIDEPGGSVTGSTITMVNDARGNLIQLTQLTWGD